MITSHHHLSKIGALTILYFNARSLLPKIDELRALTLVHKPHLICIVESWLDKQILDCEVCIDNYDIVRHDRNRQGGGVLFFVSGSLSYNVLLPGPSELELIILSINSLVLPITVGLFYRPPSAPVCIFDTLLNCICLHVDVPLLSNFILVGDFNVNLCNSHCPLLLKLQSFASSLDLTQVVSEPTHFSSSSVSLIDLVYLSAPANLISCATIPSLANSDHLGLCVSIVAGSSKANPKRSRRKIWRYSLANFERACERFNETDWDSLFASSDVNICWSNWKARFLEVMLECIPQSTLRTRRNLPWLTKSITQAIRRRNALFKAHKRSKSTPMYQKYRAARNRVTAMLRLSKARYFRKLRSQNSKDFWKSIKLLNKVDCSIPTLLSNGAEVADNCEKASLLNNFFYDCFNTKSPPLTCTPSTLPTCGCPPELLCTNAEVYDLIVGLDPSKSTGADGISAKMLRGTVDAVVPSLTRLFNLSLTTGSFPEAWKLARIVPVPKSVAMTVPSNYRPISILSVVSKLLERHVHQILFTFLSVNYPLSTRQWGFLPGRCTASALLTVTHDWLRQLELGNEVCSIFFDLKKAFDSVPHCLLLHRLEEIATDPYIVQWIRSYLTAWPLSGSSCWWRAVVIPTCSIWGTTGLCAWASTVFNFYQ